MHAVATIVVLAALKLTLRLELGAEYDSNANRAEVVKGATTTDEPTGSFLARSTARFGVAWRAGPNTLRANALTGGKLFFDGRVQDQNILVGSLSLDDRVRLARSADLSFAVDYYDAAQQTVIEGCAVRSCDRHRDFRSGTVVTRLSLFDDPGELTLVGGYRGFEWKPDPSFDFHAGQAQATAIVRLTAGAERRHEIDLTAGYVLERRFYRGLAEANRCPPGTPVVDGCLAFTDVGRSDWFHQAAVDVTYIGPVLVGVGYALQLTRSNSFGQSLLRHILTLKLSARLPWSLYVTLKGQLLANRYLDPILLDRQVNSQTFISIEDENRNAFIADVERPIGKSGVAIEGRYSVFTNELSASPVSFLRHVVYLGASYRWSGAPGSKGR